MIFKSLVSFFLLMTVNTIVHAAQDVKSAREAAGVQAHLNQKAILRNDFLNVMGEILPPVPLQRLVLEYSKKPVLTPIVDADFPSEPPVDCAQAAAVDKAQSSLASSRACAAHSTSNAHSSVAAASAGSCTNVKRYSAIEHYRRTISNIVALPNRRFALHRCTALETWQLQADDIARKEAHEHKIDKETSHKKLIPLYDGTILSVTERAFDFHYTLQRWNPQTNDVLRYNRIDWDHISQSVENKTLRNVAFRTILPLSTGKIFLFFEFPRTAFCAESINTLNRKLKRSRTQLPYVSKGIALKGDNIVLFHGGHVAVYDTVALMKNPNRRQRQGNNLSRNMRKVPQTAQVSEVAGEQIAKIDNSSFIIWGHIYGDAFQSCIEIWHLTGQKLHKKNRLVSNKKVTNAAIAHGKCFAICEDGTVQTCALAAGAQWEDVPNCTNASSLTTLSDGTVVMAHRDGSISMINNPNEHLEAFALRRSHISQTNSKEMKAKSEIPALKYATDDQKEQTIHFMSALLPKILLPLTLTYEDSTLFDTIIPPQVFPEKSTPLGASAGAAATGAGQDATAIAATNPAQENYVTIVPLPNGEFALHTIRNNTVQTWQLQHDGSAKKNEHEYKMDQKEARRHLLPLPDGTIITDVGETHFLHHWNPKANSSHSYHTSFSRFDNGSRFILPLNNGKILIYDRLGGQVSTAENVSALDQNLKPGKKEFAAADGIVLSDDSVVFTCGKQLAVYDSAALMDKANINPPKHTAQMVDTHAGIAKIDSNSFVTWTYADLRNNKNPFIEIWRVKNQKLERVHLLRLQVPKGIDHVTVANGVCYAKLLDGTIQTWDLVAGTQWKEVPNCSAWPALSSSVSMAALQNGTLLITRKDGSVCKANPSTGLGRFLESKQQKESRHKKLMDEIKTKAPQIITRTLLKKVAAAQT